MVKNNLLTSCFDDTSEIKIQNDDIGIKKISGIGTINNVDFKITISRNDIGSYGDDERRKKELYTGTISLLSPLDGKVLVSETKKREKMNSGREFKAKDCYASKEFRCDSIEPKDIAKTVQLLTSKLLDENFGQIDSYLHSTMTPDTITPSYAVDKNANIFLALEFPDSNEENNLKRVNILKKYFHMMKNIPMCKYKEKDIKALRKTQSITDENMKLLSRFWNYMILTKKAKGRNPFPEIGRPVVSVATLNKNATSTVELGDGVFKIVYGLIEKKPLFGPYRGIALALSGFTTEEILDMKWKDIKFVQGYDDYAIINLNHGKIIVAIHDFSRPAIPNTATYLKSAYNKLKKANPDCTVDEWNVVTTGNSNSKAISSAELNNEIRNVLIRAYSKAQKSGPVNMPKSLTSKLLRDTYARYLRSKAGLSDDPDTCSFLQGNILRSSTFINYESHTDDTASYRMYSILKPIAPEKDIRTKNPALIETDEHSVYTATPKTTHEVAQITGRIRLNPGESVRIKVSHGVIGKVDMLRNE